MSLASLGLLALAWLLTYLVHSTLLLGGTWAAVRWLPLRSLRWKDRLWKLALVGGLVTASVQVGARLEPFGGRYLLVTEESAVASAPEATAASEVEPTPSGRFAEFPVDGARKPVRPAARLPLVRNPAPRDHAARESVERRTRAEHGRFPKTERVVAAETTDARTAAPVVAGSTSPGAETSEGQAWQPWLAGLWALVAALGLLAFARSFQRLRAHLAGRVELEDGPLRAMLDTLCTRAGLRARVRLTASPRLAAPITLGIVRREICVPLRALSDLTPAQQEAMLGHELGHAIRRDPAWLGLCWLLETMLFVQPLNRVARKRLQQSAEYLCDDWAVRLTGRYLSLASCLTEVAQWVVGRKALPAPAMAGTGAPLTLRVQRLLDGKKPAAERRERWWRPSAVAGLLVVALAAPGFSTSVEPLADDRILDRGRVDVGLELVRGASGPFGLPRAPATLRGTPSLAEDLSLTDEVTSEVEAFWRDTKRELAGLELEPAHEQQARDIEERLRRVRDLLDQVNTLLPTNESPETHDLVPR